MSQRTILVANEYRSAREALGLAIRELRPDLDVHIVDPCDLQCAIQEYGPILIICNQLRTEVRNSSADWILLSSEGESLAVISIEGRGLRVDEAGLPQIISIVDEVVRIRKMT